MNKIVNKFLLAEDKFMSELDLKQPEFTYRTCGPFTTHGKRIQEFKEICHLKHIYKNDLDKACSANDAPYSDSKDLAKRIISDKILKDITYEIATNIKFDGFERRLTCIVYKFFDKKRGLGSRVN